MSKIILIVMSLCGLLFCNKKIIDDSKSGLSSKEAIPESRTMPNPLDRIDLQWNPPIVMPVIIDPQPVTNVNP